MRIVIVSRIMNSEPFVVGDTATHPVPRVGEQVRLFYNPPPSVVAVVYDYKAGEVVVLVE